ncbi:unnamed protein product [Linum trigynum]|uniref:Uncharacterized protein n=1 Tax=Linum trigynum TaxID=586398 RepID=A0AAV2D784_9ROSI
MSLSQLFDAEWYRLQALLEQTLERRNQEARMRAAKREEEARKLMLQGLAIAATSTPATHPCTAPPSKKEGSPSRVPREDDGYATTTVATVAVVIQGLPTSTRAATIPPPAAVEEEGRAAAIPGEQKLRPATTTTLACLIAPATPITIVGASKIPISLVETKESCGKMTESDLEWDKTLKVNFIESQPLLSDFMGKNVGIN